MPRYTYNGVTVTATNRRQSSRDDKKYERTVTIDGKDYIVHYGDPNLPMQRDNPERRANFLARHNCDTKRDPRAPGFWACLDWQRTDEGKSMEDAIETTDETEEVQPLPLPLPANRAIKNLGGNRVGGYAMIWGDDSAADLDGEWFDPQTEEMTSIY
jgi:hypothetical protein